MSDSQSRNEVLLHGVTRRAGAVDDLEAVTEELAIDGFTVVDSGLTDVELDRLGERLDDMYLRQVEEIGGADEMAVIGDTNVVRCPLASDEAFIAVAANRNLLAVVQRVLGDNFVLLQQNGISNKSGDPNYQARWHRDLSYQHWTSTAPIALNALLCIDDFTAERGATNVLVGSHRLEDFPSDRYALKRQLPAEAPRGSFLLLDAMLFHKAGQNTTSYARRAVNHLIGLPFMAQQIDIPLVLGDRYADDAVLSRYLGYRWRASSSVVDWRRSRSASAK